MLDSERLQVSFELRDLLGHLLQLSFLDLAASLLKLLLDGLVLFNACDADSTSH